MIPSEAFHYNLMEHLAPLVPLLEDPKVSEIMINGFETVFYERGGHLHRASQAFDSLQDLESAIAAMAQYMGRHVDAENPILEGHLPDGSRVEAVLPPAAADGPMVAIRRFRKETMSLQHLVELGALPTQLAKFLTDQVVSKQNILVSGGTGSGKTTLLNALAAVAPPDDRIVVLEDARELQINMPHVVQLEARPADNRGRGRVTIRDLFRATLRMRPDRIVVGEIRGGEALELVQAMTSGHGGCLSTIHSSHPRDALARLETLALMSDVALPLSALRPQVASAIDFIVQVCRNGDGSRTISEVARVGHHDPDRGVDLETVYERPIR